MFSRRDILLTMSNTGGRKPRCWYSRWDSVCVGCQAADGEPFYFYGEFAAAEAHCPLYQSNFRPNWICLDVVAVELITPAVLNGAEDP